jgi:hypothetical protein
MFDALRHGVDYGVSIFRTQGAASVLHLVVGADRLAAFKAANEVLKEMGKVD